MTKQISIRITPIILFLAIACAATNLFAGIHFTGSGSWAQNHLGLETHTSRVAKGAVSIDLGPYLRLGYTYTDSYQLRKGWIDDSSDESGENPVYVPFEQTVTQQNHSIDLFAVLYAGQIFTPYIFGGLAMRTYKIVMERADRPKKTSIGPWEPGPNLGCGLSVQLSKSFALKVSNTWSDGTSATADGKIKKVRDSQLDAGITYTID